MIDYTNTYAADLESNGLRNKPSPCTKIWVIALAPMGEKVSPLTVETYHDYPELEGQILEVGGQMRQVPVRAGSLKDGAKKWYKIIKDGGKLSIHHGLNFDVPLVAEFFKPFDKLVGDETKPIQAWDVVRDTLVQSKVQHFERSLKNFNGKWVTGRHGLAEYGEFFGYQKPPVEDWTKMDALKIIRVIDDVVIQSLTQRYLDEEAETLLEKRGLDFSEGIYHDSRYVYNGQKQETNKATVDVDHGNKCVTELTQIIADLKAEIEPQLPLKVKMKALKITKTELFKDLGRDPIKHCSGSKNWYKPVTRIRRRKKYKSYSVLYDGVPLAIEASFKKTEAKAKVKEYFFKDFDFDPKKITYIWEEVYRDNGYYESIKSMFGDDLGVTLDVVGPFTRVEFNSSTMSQHEQVKLLLLTLGWKQLDDSEWNFKRDVDGSWLKSDTGGVTYWPSEKGFKGFRLECKYPRNGRIPTTPKLTEDSFNTLPEGLGRKVANYNTYSHRLNFFRNPNNTTKGVLNNLIDGNRLSCGVFTFGTATGRGAQTSWVNAPGIGALYGEETRRLIVPSNEDRVLVGADMKAAQLAIAAYYANNYDYYLAVVDGQEVIKDDEGVEIYVGESGHCVNARFFGLVSNEDFERAKLTQDPEILHEISLKRKFGKAGTFATIFGASGKKIAQTLKIPESEGQAAKDSFLSSIGLEESIAILERMTDRNGGYIELPMGYFNKARQKHKLFNYLDQGTEAVCQKIAINLFEERLTIGMKAGNIDAIKVIDYHDEFLTDSHEDCAEEIGKMMCKAYEDASNMTLEWHQKHSKWFKHLSFAFNLDGGYKVGKSYLEVH